MSELEPPDTHYLSAALGWHELGCPADALLELDRISPAQQSHSDVLEIRWEVHAGRKDWEEALRYAELLVQQHPQRSSGWLHRAYALRRVPHGGLNLAWAALFPAHEKFPKVPLIAYNLACYAAQFGRLEESWDWLQKAIAVGDRDRIKSMASSDSDLTALWDRIQTL